MDTYTTLCAHFTTPFFHTVCLLSEANDAKIKKMFDKRNTYDSTNRSTNGLKISQVFPLNAKKIRTF